jgi:PAS domain S-box-containing protein
MGGARGQITGGSGLRPGWRAPYLVLAVALLFTLAATSFIASPGYAAVVLLLGIGISGVLFGVVRSEARARATAEQVAAELRHVQEARREGEAGFRLLFETNPMPMWVYDVQTLYFLEVNAAAVAHYGYSRSEFLRMRLLDIRPPEEADRVMATVATLAEAPTGEVRRHARTWTHRLKDGRLRDVEVTSHSIDFGGRRAALVVATDVTELTRTQDALARSSERLTILHEIDQAVIAARPPVEIAGAALRRLQALLGVPRAIVNIFDLAAGEVEWLAAAGRRRVRTGPGVRFSLALMGDVEGLRRGELQVIDVEPLAPSLERDALLGGGVRKYMVVPMIAGGELIGGLSFGGEPDEFPAEHIRIVQEVAAQLAIAIAQARLAERVQQQTEQLEVRVQARTMELFAANQQLELEIADRRRAEAEADRANKAKSEFLSRMSHELRTPLNGILGFAQLMEMEGLPPGQRESVQHILRAGRHLLGLINEVLHISRIESGRLQVSLEAVSVKETLGAAVDLVRPSASDREITLTVAGPAEERHVLADRQRLQQVFLNLLSNAVKYNRRAGEVKISCEDVPDGVLRIRVRDTGPGIAPDKLDRLFTPFDRLGAEMTDVEGTGLGLTLSKHLVEVMGGTMAVESCVGDGSTFSVELPVVPPPTEALGDLAARIPLPADTNGKAAVVLYIEDNPANLRLVERVLARRPKMKLLSALQGGLGFELAREHQPDLILLDLHLPDVSGDEVLGRLVAEPRTREIPVVVLSADATPGQVDRLLAAGARAYLTKPLDVRKLLTLLDESIPGGGG